MARRWPLALGTAGVVAATAAVGWLVGGDLVAPTPAPTPSARPTPVSTPSPARTPADRLAAAERAAFPAGRSHETAEGTRVVYAPGTLVDAPFGPVLVSQGEVPDASHVDSGYVGIHYLRADGDAFAVARAFPEAVKSGSFGSMSELAVSAKFGALPVVYAQGGGTWQGTTCTWTTLTELRPEGPKELVTFLDSFADGNSDTDEGTQGKIADIVPGRSFAVRFTGARTFTARYVRRGDRYVLADGEALAGC